MGVPDLSLCTAGCERPSIPASRGFQVAKHQPHSLVFLKCKQRQVVQPPAAREVSTMARSGLKPSATAHPRHFGAVAGPTSKR